MPKIAGPGSGYKITPQAREQGQEISNQQVLGSAGRAGEAQKPEVQQAVDEALADGRLTRDEFEGGHTARLLRKVGIDAGGSILSAMKNDELLQRDKIDPADYLECQQLLERGQLPEGHADRIQLDAGARAALEKIVDGFQQKLIEGPQGGAFIETVQDPKLGAQKLVNQTAMTWAPVESGDFMQRFPPERWAEECYDLKSLHNEVLERRDLPDGGYEVTMLQRMEFGEGSTATDMTKRTVVRKWKDEETNRWRATAQWQVYSSDPTAQIPHAGSMRIDTGRMEFRPVERDGRWFTEVTFNNATQTNTKAEEKLLGLFGKNTPLRQSLSANMGASQLGILPFAREVVGRYRAVGSGEIEPRWPQLKAHTDE